YDNNPLGMNDGFLPIGGLGSVEFSVPPSSGAPDGAPITNQATITFDGDQKSTPTWSNTLSNTTLPRSHVSTAVPTSGALSNTVTWAADSPSVTDYTICVAEDSGQFWPWRSNTHLTTDTLGISSDHHAHTYKFYSVARDQFGNTETK